MGFTDTYLLDSDGQQQMIILDVTSQQAIFYSIA